MESELFGHEKGAFTGAIGARIGRFEEADGGTLFIDEIGDVPLNIQVKLLRAIQFREVQRLGSNETKKVDVRIVAATHRNLENMMEQGDFREDLYYRLNVVTINIPTLRERKEDISLLMDWFVQHFNKKMRKNITEFPGSVLKELQDIAQFNGCEYYGKTNKTYTCIARR